MTHAFVCEGIRTSVGRCGGTLSALPLQTLMRLNPEADWAALDEVNEGCANQAGEDNRGFARMATLLAGLPVEVPGATVKRLCGSRLDAVGLAAREIICGETALIVAGGVESMSRAPFVMPWADAAFSRAAAIHDTTIG